MPSVAFLSATAAAAAIVVSYRAAATAAVTAVITATAAAEEDENEENKPGIIASAHNLTSRQLVEGAFDRLHSQNMANKQLCYIF